MTMNSEPWDPEPVVRRYLLWLQARSLSPETIRTARSQLSTLARWHGGPILYLAHDDLTRWQVDTAARVTPGSLRSAMSTHRAFYRWAVTERLLDDDPTARLVMPRAPRRLPRPIAEDRLTDTISAADDRLRVVLGLAAFAGLRACEISRLEWSEVDLGPDAHLRVVGKGGHERVVDVSPALAAMLRRVGPGRGPVVSRLDGRAGHVAPVRVSQEANRHLHSCGVPETLHQLRHRFATRMYDTSAGDLRAVQEALGHASPVTTAGYARVSRRSIRAAVLAAGQLTTGGTAA